MKTLIVFNRPVVVPDDNDEKLEIYGFVADKEKWENCAFKTNYIYCYVLVIAELFKEGIIGKFGLYFKQDGTPFTYRDFKWKEYEERVRESDIKYAVVEKAVELDENDYYKSSFLTSKEKWLELIGKGGLVWL